MKANKQLDGNDTVAKKPASAGFFIGG